MMKKDWIFAIIKSHYQQFNNISKPFGRLVGISNANGDKIKNFVEY